MSGITEINERELKRLNQREKSYWRLTIILLILLSLTVIFQYLSSYGLVTIVPGMESHYKTTLSVGLPGLVILFCLYTTAKRRAGVEKVGGIHALRHAFSTHSLEAGMDLPTLGRMLGHTSVTTTMRYLHTTGKRVSAQISPLDRLLLGKPLEDEPDNPPTR